MRILLGFSQFVHPKIVIEKYWIIQTNLCLKNWEREDGCVIKCVRVWMARDHLSGPLRLGYTFFPKNVIHTDVGCPSFMNACHCLANCKGLSPWDSLDGNGTLTLEHFSYHELKKKPESLIEIYDCVFCMRAFIPIVFHVFSLPDSSLIDGEGCK